MFVLLMLLVTTVYAGPNQQQIGCKQFYEIKGLIEKGCPEEIPKAMLEAQTTESNKDCKLPEVPWTSNSQLVSVAANNFCPKALEQLSAISSDSDFATPFAQSPYAGSQWFTDIAFEKLKNTMEDEKEKISQIMGTLKIIGTRIKDNCKTNIKESCRAQKQLERFKAKVSQAAEEEEKEMAKKEEYNKYQQSSEYILENVCPLKSALKRHEAILKHENEVQKISGVSNLQNRHNSGSWIVSLKPKISDWEKAYFQKAKRKLTDKDCIGFTNKAE